MPATASPVPCRGPSRRDLLRVGLLGVLGLGLDDWLRLRALGAASGATRPVKAMELHLDLAGGGPSHLDTFDPKPTPPRVFAASSR